MLKKKCGSVVVSLSPLHWIGEQQAFTILIVKINLIPAWFIQVLLWVSCFPDSKNQIIKSEIHLKKIRAHQLERLASAAMLVPPECKEVEQDQRNAKRAFNNLESQSDLTWAAFLFKPGTLSGLFRGFWHSAKHLVGWFRAALRCLFTSSPCGHVCGASALPLVWLGELGRWVSCQGVWNLRELKAVDWLSA